MNKIRARSLLNYTTEALWEILTGRFILIFDDGVELETDFKQTLYSSYFWDFHREYPQTPLLAKHHVKSVIKTGYITSETLNRMLEACYWDTVDTLGIKNPKDRMFLTDKIFGVTNKLYNEIQLRIEAYVTTTDALDFIEVMDHPRILEMHNNPVDSSEYIASCENVITDVLNNDTTLDNNNLAKATRAKRLKLGQLLQCVGPRGYPAEVDGMIYRKPITVGYGHGMHTAYEAIAESRTAPKALYFAEAPLEDSEYFARRLQLVCMTIENIHYEDCGSQDYELWRMTGPHTRADGSKYRGDLEFMEGKYYLSDSGKLESLTLKDTHLYGHTIRLRTVNKCKHIDSHGVCAVCFGTLADNINPRANIGHVSAGTMNKQTTQNTLSTKHLASSSSNDPIVLDNISEQFFRTDRDRMRYYFKKQVVSARASLVIKKEEAQGLSDIFLIDDVRKLANTRIAALKGITISQVVKGEVINTGLSISKQNRPAAITPEFLAYIKRMNWVIDAQGNYRIDLSQWEHMLPVFELPPMEVSYAEHSKLVAMIIEGKDNPKDDKREPMNISEHAFSLLCTTFDVVNSKLKVHMSLIEINIYAYLVVDQGLDDYGLSRNRGECRKAPRNSLILGRSLSVAYAFEKQDLAIFNPQSFFPLGRVDSPMDVAITPDEVVREYG